MSIIVRPLLLAAFVLTAIVGNAIAHAGGGPLPSWNEVKSKSAIIEFVERVTKKDSPDFVPPDERIAVFDNDGTLWPENPVPFQLAYALDSLQQMAVQKPELRGDPMVKASLAGDFAKLLEGPRHDGLLRIVALTHAGMTTVEFDASKNWLMSARHPRFAHSYDQLTYQPTVVAFTGELPTIVKISILNPRSRRNSEHLV